MSTVVQVKGKDEQESSGEESACEEDDEYMEESGCEDFDDPGMFEDEEQEDGESMCVHVCRACNTLGARHRLQGCIAVDFKTTNVMIFLSPYSLLFLMS